jgi:menaquinone-9 beta-reductase
MVNTTEVFVVGGGPAGLAAALAVRKRGLEVVVADGDQPPIDKACGEGLMPDGRAALAELGVQIAPESSYPFRGIRFVSGNLTVEANFPSGIGIGVRRTALHPAMVASAESAGISLLWNTPVTGLDTNGVRIRDHLVRARWVIGADGGQSLVRQWAGLDRYSYNRTRFAFRRHYRLSPWTDYMELHWGPGCQIYVTPTAADEICVALISRDRHLRLDAALPAFQELAVRLRGAEPASAERGAVSATRKLRRVHKGPVALIGDASGTVDAITGEGLCLSFRQAEALAECLAIGNLEPYQRLHRALAKRPALMARLMLTLDGAPSFRQRVFRAFVSDPRLFDRMLAMHVGALSPLSFASSGLALGWRTVRG